MFDIWNGNIELTSLVLVFSIVVLLPTQILLCFKVKSSVRLLPVIVLSILTICFAIMSIVISGWDGLGYIFLAIFSGFMLLMCGIGWGVWAIIKRKNQKQ